MTNISATTEIDKPMREMDGFETGCPFLFSVCLQHTPLAARALVVYARSRTNASNALRPFFVSISSLSRLFTSCLLSFNEFLREWASGCVVNSKRYPYQLSTGTCTSRRSSRTSSSPRFYHFILLLIIFVVLLLTRFSTPMLFPIKHPCSTLHFL